MPTTAALKPEDVVVALLAQVQKITGSRFEADPVSLHTHFFDLRANSQSAALLDDFVFDNRDYFPFSETLERVLDGLQFAGYLERTNPRGTWYQITPALVELFDAEIKQEFQQQQLAAIEKLATSFVDAIKTDKIKGSYNG